VEVKNEAVQVTSHVDVAVMTIVEVEDGEELTEGDICDKACGEFGDIETTPSLVIATT